MNHQDRGQEILESIIKIVCEMPTNKPSHTRRQKPFTISIMIIHLYFQYKIGYILYLSRINTIDIIIVIIRNIFFYLLVNREKYPQDHLYGLVEKIIFRLIFAFPNIFDLVYIKHRERD